MAEEVKYNKKGEKILYVKEKKNYTITYVEQKGASNNLEEFYRIFAKIIYNQAVEA